MDKNTKTFKSKYLFRKVRTNAISTIKSVSTDTSFSDESIAGEDKMVATGANEVINDSMTADFDQGRQTAHIDVSRMQLSGENSRSSEEHGRVPIRRELPKKRTLPKEPYPFAFYEKAQEMEVEEVNVRGRRVKRVNGITYDLLN